MICTHWQPAYTPPGFTRVIQPEPGTVLPPTDNRVLAYLEQHGMKSRADIQRDLQITHEQLRYSVTKLQGLIEFEQSGNGKLRICNYWALSNPPTTSQRCGTHRVHEWFRRNPWSSPCDIPGEIFQTATSKHACVWTLELSGKLVSRVFNGKKQYKAVV